MLPFHMVVQENAGDNCFQFITFERNAYPLKEQLSIS